MISSKIDRVIENNEKLSVFKIFIQKTIKIIGMGILRLRDHTTQGPPKKGYFK